MPPASASEPPGGPPRLICRCLGVSSVWIWETIQAQGLTRLAEIQSTLKAGTGCSTCRAEIEELLADARGEPMPKLDRIQNRTRCREETARRIEASLYTGIVAKLPEGTCVELVSLQGLRVELHVSPVDDPALRELISERLKKLVCADLEIAFCE